MDRNFEFAFQHHNDCVIYYPSEAIGRLYHISLILSFKEYFEKRNLDYELHSVKNIHDFKQYVVNEKRMVCYADPIKETILYVYTDEKGEKIEGTTPLTLSQFSSHDSEAIEYSYKSEESKMTTLKDLWIINDESDSKIVKAMICDRLVFYYYERTNIVKFLIKYCLADLYSIFFQVVDFINTQKLKLFKTEDKPKETKKVEYKDIVVSVNQGVNYDEEFFDYGFHLHPDAIFSINYWTDGILQIVRNKLLVTDIDLTIIYDKQIEDLKEKLERTIVPLSIIKWVLQDNENPLVFMTFENFLNLKPVFYYAAKMSTEKVMDNKESYLVDYNKLTEEQWEDLDNIGINLYDIIDLSTRKTSDIIEMYGFIFYGRSHRPNKAHKLFSTEKGTKASAIFRRKIVKELNNSVNVMAESLIVNSKGELYDNSKLTFERLNDNFINEAIACDHINDALTLIQWTINQNDGGIAGVFFSDDRFTETDDGNFIEWRDGSYEKRKKILEQYIEFEKLHNRE